MNPELAYFLKINVGIALFYAFYRLFFYKDTFFHWRRTTLLCFFLLSLIYPMMNIQDWVKEQEPMVAMANLYATIVLPEFTVQSQKVDWRNILLDTSGFLYWGGVALLLIRLLIQLCCIIRLRINSRVEEIKGIRVHLLKEEAGPFSFFHWIFVHPASHSEEELGEILTHELAHARQHHSADVIVSELMCIICWFNPFVWLMKREVRSNLEYMADNRVIQTGHDYKSYQFHLLGLAHQKAAATLSNSFNVLPLKNRIKMMNKKRTKEIGRTKYLIFLPLAALLMIISNIEAVARTTEKWAKEIGQTVKQEIAPTVAVATPPQDKKKEPQQKVKPPQGEEEAPIFEVVEQMPDFPGGMVALMKFINTTIQYPKEAQAAGTQGRVIVLFVVEVDGTVTNQKIVKSVEPSLDAEALRIASKMPKWIPGKQKGKAVRTAFSIPVMFRLNSQGKAEEIKSSQLSEIVAVGYATDEEVQKEVVFEVVEEMPKFPGGMEALMKHLAQNIKYPSDAQKDKIEGRVIVQMIIDKEGYVTAPQVIRSVSTSLDAEAIRVLSTLPQWEPGKQRGQTVLVKYTIPITFKLTEPVRQPVVASVAKN